MVHYKIKSRSHTLRKKAAFYRKQQHGSICYKHSIYANNQKLEIRFIFSL